MSHQTPRDQAETKRRFGKRWIALGGIGLVAAAVVAVTVLHRLTATSSVTVDQLDSALLDGDQINTIMAAVDMQLGEPKLTPEKPTFALSKPECLSAIAAAQMPAYVASGYTGLRWAEARPTGDTFDHYVAQSVAVFPDATAAGAFVEGSAARWQTCAEQVVVVMQADKSVVEWALKTVVGAPPSITISETRRDANWMCQRAIRAVSNAVIDDTACGWDIIDQGALIADKIAANMAK